jgi:hypothetical protein
MLNFTLIKFITCNLLQGVSDHVFLCVIDTNFNVIIKPIYDFISNSWRSGFRVKKNNKWGILDANGKAITPIMYEEVGPSGRNTFCAKQNGKWGLL